MKIVNICRWSALAAAIGLVSAGSVHADHGPGTSGGGSSTQSAETLKPGKFSAELRLDYTEFEDLSDTQIERKTARAGDFDLLDRSFLETLSVSYGIVENFQVGLSIGLYQAKQAREAEFDETSGETEFATLDPDGLTDLWLTGKWRFYRGPIGQFATYGGVKFPTGRHNVHNSAGERVEPAATAGTGAYDGMVGLAFSRYLTSRLTIDVSGQYTIRGESDDFKLGNRIDGGVALAYRFNEDITKYPQFSAFGELNVRHLSRSEEEGDRDPNTGGTVLFLSPGVRASFTRNVAFTVSPQIPLLQDLNGEQLKTLIKVNAGLTVSF
jgi:hypothetical protein